MILITCVDDKNGMMFNSRRQSRDKIIIQNICELAENEKIWITEYSKSLFEPERENIVISNQDFFEAELDEYCFVENIAPSKIENDITKIVLYCWNKEYPADLYFDLELEDWILESEIEFEGSSHEKITRKIFKIAEDENGDN